MPTTHSMEEPLGTRDVGPRLASHAEQYHQELLKLNNSDHYLCTGCVGGCYSLTQTGRLDRVLARPWMALRYASEYLMTRSDEGISGGE
jgi:hypothetical protein